MKKLILKTVRLILFAMVIVMGGTSAGNAQSISLKYDEVDCRPTNGYGSPVSSYCHSSDGSAFSTHLLLRAIDELSAGEKIEKLFIALWAFTDVSSVIQICNSMLHPGMELSVSVQKDTGSERAISFLEQCGKQKGISVRKFFFGMEPGGLNSFHPKAIFVETSTRKGALVGSGNISSGRNNFDYVLLAFREKDASVVNESTQFIDWIECFATNLNSTRFTSDWEAVLDLRSTCSHLNIGSKFFVLPADGKSALIRMAFAAGKAIETKVATQGFKSADITFLLSQAIAQGRHVKLLLDDDIYWSNVYPNGEYMNSRYEYEKHLIPLIEKGVEVRYVVTNHNSQVKNYLHAKLYIFKDIESKVEALIGSANATASAFNDNLELLYLVDGDGGISVDQMFDAIWSKAIPHLLMPDADPNIK